MFLYMPQRNSTRNQDPSTHQHPVFICCSHYVTRLNSAQLHVGKKAKPVGLIHRISVCMRYRHVWYWFLSLLVIYKFELQWILIHKSVTDKEGNWARFRFRKSSVGCKKISTCEVGNCCKNVRKKALHYVFSIICLQIICLTSNTDFTHDLLMLKWSEHVWAHRF